MVVKREYNGDEPDTSSLSNFWTSKRNEEEEIPTDYQEQLPSSSHPQRRNDDDDDWESRMLKENEEMRTPRTLSFEERNRGRGLQDHSERRREEDSLREYQRMMGSVSRMSPLEHFVQRRTDGENIMNLSLLYKNGEPRDMEPRVKRQWKVVPKTNTRASQEEKRGGYNTQLGNSFEEENMREKENEYVKEREESKIDAHKVADPTELEIKVGESCLKIEKEIEEMKLKNEKPKASKYAQLIKAYGEDGQIEKIGQVVNEIEKEGIKIGLLIYNAILQAFAAHGQVKKMEVIFEEMKKSIKPSAVTFSHLLTGYAEGGEIRKMENILPLVESSGHKLTLAMYGTIIKAYSNAGALKKLELVFSQMLSENLKPDLETCSVLLTAFGESGNLKKVEEVLSFMELNSALREVLTEICKDQDTLNTALERIGMGATGGEKNG